MCSFRKIGKPRRAEERAASVLRNEAERPGGRGMVPLAWHVQERMFSSSCHCPAGARLGLLTGAGALQQSLHFLAIDSRHCA